MAFDEEGQAATKFDKVLILLQFSLSKWNSVCALRVSILQNIFTYWEDFPSTEAIWDGIVTIIANSVFLQENVSSYRLFHFLTLQCVDISLPLNLIILLIDSPMVVMDARCSLLNLRMIVKYIFQPKYSCQSICRVIYSQNNACNVSAES